MGEDLIDQAGGGSVTIWTILTWPGKCTAGQHVVRAIPTFILCFLVFLVYFLLFVLCFQYQCKWLPGKTRFWN